MLASAHPSIETELARALEKAGTYEWKTAAELYRQALEKLGTDKEAALAGELTELQANCYFKAAFQSRTRDEFLGNMQLSRDTQEKAANIYEKAGSAALTKRSMARGLFASFWMQDEAAEKRVIMEKCMPLVQQAAHTFQVHSDKDQLAETLLDLLVYREKAFQLSTERKQLVDHFEAALETAWRIIEELQGVARDEIILESIDILVQLYVPAEQVLEPSRYNDLEKKLGKIKDRIPQLAEKINSRSAQALACEASGMLAGDLEGDIPKSLGLLEEGASKGNEIRDYYLVGRLQLSASALIRYSALSEEYVEKRREELEKARELASSAIQNLHSSSPEAWLKYAYARYVDASTLLAQTVETDPEKKRTTLRKTIETARKGMVYEKRSFSPQVGPVLSKAMYFLASMDVGPEEKDQLLSEALPIREETVSILEQLCPHSWDRGVMLNYLALLKAELSKIAKDQSRKLELLNGAASDMGECVRLCATPAGSGTVPGKIRAQALYNEWHGDVLQQLYNTTMDTSVARQAVAAYEEAISYLTKSDSVGPIPAVRWKIAKTYDSLREYKEASQFFHQAADEYRLAGKKLPRLALVFEEFSHYMEAWALIGDARGSHDQELYTAAAEGYTKAANLLRTSQSWSYLSKHYSACSFLELGEALSRQDRQHSAIESFQAAQATFQESKNELDSKLPSVSPSQEKRELMDWLDITRGRLKYTRGRIQLEDAKVLDARGEEEASSAKYRTASETFGSLLSEIPHEQTRRELESLRHVCDAWAKMKAAEARASPELYAEAADSFTAVERTALGKRSKLAALANASMCKALESGSLFRRTRDKQLYAEIKRRLETAADFYEEAGIRKAADWTRATQRFFDALTYLGEAEIETDARKKTEFYHLAEKHLHLAAKLYGDAGYSKKKEEALRHLERAREEQQLLPMPVEVLAESPAVSEVAATPISLTGDVALGLERFETAHVVGSISSGEREVHAGEVLTLDLEIANIGRTAATIVRIENVLAKGLEPAKEKTQYPIEENAVNMRGKRLEYLKTHELKITFRARRKGVYEIKPRIVFVDEKGNQGFYELDATTLTVRELGVLGWIKGPG